MRADILTTKPLPVEPLFTLHEIAQFLWVDGRKSAYEALKQHIIERDALIAERDALLNGYTPE